MSAAEEVFAAYPDPEGELVGRLVELEEFLAWHELDEALELGGAVELVRWCELVFRLARAARTAALERLEHPRQLYSPGGVEVAPLNFATFRRDDLAALPAIVAKVAPSADADARQGWERLARWAVELDGLEAAAEYLAGYVQSVPGSLRFGRLPFERYRTVVLVWITAFHGGAALERFALLGPEGFGS